MPAFDAEVLDATAVVDELYGEEFIVRPYSTGANVNAPLAPDLTRDVVSLVGIWIVKPANPREPNEWDVREYRRPGVEGDIVHVEFSASAIACLVGFEIREGDRIERAETCTAYTARMASFTSNGTMRVTMNLLGKVA